MLNQVAHLVGVPHVYLRLPPPPPPPHVKRLFRRRSKKTSTLRVTGLCEGNSPVINHKGPVTRKIFPFDDVIIYTHNKEVTTSSRNTGLWRGTTRNHEVNSTLIRSREAPGPLLLTWINFKPSMDKQRVLMHRHQGWNVRHGLCHSYMRYLYIYELFIAFVCFVVCSLL